MTACGATAVAARLCQMVRRAPRHRTLLLLVMLLVAVGGAPRTAIARTVAIIFDDSRSIMRGINLPAFATTTLMGTLDGKNDRVLMMPFRSFYKAYQNHPDVNLPESTPAKDVAEAVGGLAFGFGLTQRLYDGLSTRPFAEERFPTPAEHQRMLDRWGKSLAQVYHGTPYGSIETMLEVLRRETVAGEEVHLVILTDGEFWDEPPTRAQRAALIDSMKQWAAAIVSDVSVSFVLILPSADSKNNAGRANELVKKVDSEGIREGLLTAFNGSPDKGSFTVNSAPSLWQALQDIIAVIARTDRTAQRETITVSGNQIALKTPFAVTRIIAVATRSGGAAPAFRSGSFQGTATRLSTRMLAPDADYPGVQFNAAISQFQFDPPLPAGNHSLEFDQPVGEDVFLLFDTEVDARLSIIDTVTMQEALRSAEGRYLLTQQHSYRFAMQLVDPLSAQPVAFAALPPATAFTVVLEGGTVLTMAPDAAASAAFAGFVPQDIGTFGAGGDVKIPGFVQPRTATVAFDVAARAVVLTLKGETRAEPCPACSAGQIRLTISPAVEPDVPVSTMMIGVDTTLDGEVQLGITGLPAFLVLQDDTGKVLQNGDSVKIAAGQDSFGLNLLRRGRPDNFDPDSDLAGGFAITLQPAGTLTGDQLTVQRSLTVDVAAPQLDPVLPGTAEITTAYIDLPDSALLAPAQGLEFLLQGAVTQVPTAGDFVAGFSGWMPSLVSIEGHDFTQDRLAVRPSTSFVCLCGISVYSLMFGPERRFEVRYADRYGLQTASATGQFRILHDLRRSLSSCALNFALLVVLLWLLGAQIATLRTNRFPRLGYCREIDGATERLYPLRGRNMTFLKALLWPVMGVPHERALVGPFDLRASAEGVALLISRETPMEWRMGEGKTIAELNKRNPEMTSLDWIWNRPLFQAHDKRHYFQIFIDKS